MKVAIHQPNFLPWIGFWHKFSMVDTFILLDTVQFASKQFQNRTQIRRKHGAMWITVPTKKHQDTPIKDVLIANEHRWSAPMVRTLAFEYKMAPYFDEYHRQFSYLIDACNWDKLSDMNTALIRQLQDELRLPADLYVASAMKSTGEGNEYLVSLVKEVGGDSYVTGSTDKDYHEPKVFEDAGIEVIDQAFEHPEYPQCRPGFVPECSVVDLLFNHGPDSKEIICKSQ